MHARYNLFTTLCVSLIACGGGSSGGKIDAHKGVDSGDDDQIDAAPTCAIADTLGDLSTFPGGEGVFVDPGSGSDPDTRVTWFGDTASGDDPTDVEFQLAVFSGGGSGTDDLATPDWPTTLTPKSGLALGAADAIAFGLADIGSDGTPGALYFIAAAPDGGTLTLTQAGSAIGATYAGTIESLGLIHVDFDASTGAISGADPDGCQTVVSSVTMSGTVAADPRAFAPSKNGPRGHVPAAAFEFARNYVLSHRSK